MNYRTIVAGTDGSESANLAVGRAARLAKHLDARLVLVCASAPVGITDLVAGEILDQARAIPRRHGLEAETVLREGAADPVLSGVAADRGADLIVVGNRGMGKARRLRLGTVAEQVAHRAPCDVLIVDTHGPAEERDPIYPKLVVGTDGSPTATDATALAFDLGMIFGVGVVVVTVTSDEIVAGIKLEETLKLKPRALGVTTKILPGDPAEKIVETAKEEEAGLIVVGNRGMAGARRVLLGSVPSKVAHLAPTDVLIARTVGKTLADLHPGRGGVVTVDGRKVAVFVDDDGRRHAISPRCTHMGCTVGWNAAERTWDCPCHGSRYAVDGSVIRGPAKKALDPEGLPGA